MVRFILLIVSTALAPAVLAAPDPLTLDAAVELALARAPQLRASTAALEAAQSLEVSAGRQPDPAVIVGVENFPVTGPDAFTTDVDAMSMRQIGLMQTFKPLGQRGREREVANAESLLAGANLGATRYEVMRQAANAWVRFASAHQALNDLQSLDADVALGATSARAALRSGRASAAEALSADAAASQLTSRKLELQGELRRSEAELARWIGVENLSAPATTPAMDDLPAPATVLRESLANHVLVLPLDARVDLARAEVELARTSRRPGFTAELMYGKRGPQFDDMASLQFTVDLPIFARTRQSPLIAAKSADLRRVEAERDAEIAMHVSELDQMLTTWQELGDRLKFIEAEQLPLSRARSRATLAAYRGGQGDLRDSIEAFRDESELLIERARLQRERGEAWTYLRYLHLPAR